MISSLVTVFLQTSFLPNKKPPGRVAPVLAKPCGTAVIGCAISVILDFQIVNFGNAGNFWQLPLRAHFGPQAGWAFSC
jgi:hypothetical protein